MYHNTLEEIIMSFNLYIMRHAKSDWSTDVSDFDRPINERGIKNAKRIAIWMQENNMLPELILCSTAVRAKQTVEQFDNIITDETKEQINFDRQLYLADAETILDKIKLFQHGVKSLMIIAHNPGLDYLVNQLSRNSLPYDKKGKLMTTASLAIFRYANTNFTPVVDQTDDMQIIRPKELD